MKRAHIPKEPMGKVIVKIKLTNHADVILTRAGARKAKPRQTEVEALVDTGATRLYLKPSVIEKRGLERGEYDEVNLDLMGRSATLQVIEVPEDVPNLLGQIPLELLDFVVDPSGQWLL